MVADNHHWNKSVVRLEALFVEWDTHQEPKFSRKPFVLKELELFIIKKNKNIDR